MTGASEIIAAYRLAAAKGITQEEFANVTLGSSARYLRKILTGQRSGVKLREKARRGGGLFLQDVETKEGWKSAVLANPEHNDTLHFFTAKQERIRKATTKKALEKRILERKRDERQYYRQLYNKYGTKRETYRPVQNSKGLKLGDIKRVRTTRARAEIIKLNDKPHIYPTGKGVARKE